MGPGRPSRKSAALPGGKLAYRMKRRLGAGREVLILERASCCASRHAGSTAARAPRALPRRLRARLLGRAAPSRLPRGHPLLSLRRPPQDHRFHRREAGHREDPRTPRPAYYRTVNSSGPLASPRRVFALARRRPRSAAIAALTGGLVQSLKFQVRGRSPEQTAGEFGRLPGMRTGRPSGPNIIYPTSQFAPAGEVQHRLAQRLGGDCSVCTQTPPTRPPRSTTSTLFLSLAA